MSEVEEMVLDRTGGKWDDPLNKGVWVKEDWETPRLVNGKIISGADARRRYHKSGHRTIE